MGKVYYPAKGVRTDDQIVVRYMEYPWISTFEVEGIQVIPPENEADEQPEDSMQNNNKDGSIR